MKSSSEVKWRWGKHPISEVEHQLPISIVARYVLNLSTMCDFPEWLSSAFRLAPHQLSNWDPQIVEFLKQHLKEVFVVPRLKKLYQTQNRINKFHLLQAFLSFLLQLLYHKTDQIVDPFKDGIESLEKELRFLLTILGDTSWMLCHSHAEFQSILPQFEAVANQAGSFVRYLFFFADQAFGKTDMGLAAVLKDTELLKANLESFVSIPAAAYTTPTPTTSIVDSILILDSLVDDLEDLLKREDDPIADIKDQVNILYQELLLSHSSINEMRSPRPSEIEELKEPLMLIGGIAHQAEYLITSFLVKDAPLWYVFNRLTHLNRMIRPITTELQLITQNYQFGGLKVAEYVSAQLPLHDKHNTKVNDTTVGFEDKTTEILDQLVGGGTQSLQIISILGMPGLGKTTLANKLYNHPLVNYTFDKFTWCVVSQTYQICDILSTILVQIESKFGKDSNLNMQETSLVQHIYQTLKGRRYMIVLDDIWDSNVLDTLLRYFPDDGNGSRILVTSRNKDVVPTDSIKHELPFLTDEECWELLEKKAFGCRTCPARLQGIGKKIAARCCGIPLTVVVIAGVLSSVDEEEGTWEEVGRSLAMYIDGEDNSVMQILELSYKHLPDHLKPCFLYFGEFVEDKEISIGKLKRLWVAEGFVRKEKERSAENIAEEYLMELIDKSMVIIGKRRRDGRGAKSCVVHDLLRELCLKKSKEESFLKYLDSDYHTIYEKGHRLRAFGENATLSHCQEVRSFFGNYPPSSSFYVRDMKLLRVLYFKIIYGIEKLTFGIEYLVNLKYLVIGDFPPWIDRLVNLEYLRAMTFTTRVLYIPSTIVKMKKLRYLYALPGEYGDDWNSNQTNNLEYLSIISIKNLKDEELLKCSPNLHKLKCTYDMGRVMGNKVWTYPHFDLRFLTQLHSLFLIGFLSKGNFRFPSYIRKLTLHGSALPWEKISIVGTLEFLEVLKLREHAFVGEKWDTKDGEFQKLRVLQLYCIPYLSEWNVASNDHFPKLRQLILSCCSHLEEIPTEIGEITTLELIEVGWGCLKSVVESAEKIKEQQRDMGNKDLRVIIC